MPVGGPAARRRGLDERDGVVEQPARRVVEGRPQVQGQPRPLELVPDRDAVGAERVRRLVAVVLGQRLPVRGEVLGEPPVPLPRPAVHHPLHGAQRLPAEPRGPRVAVPQGVGGGHRRLHAVHVGVHAAIGGKRLPVAGEFIAEKPDGVVPEPVLKHLRDVGQQPAGLVLPHVQAGERDVERADRLIVALLDYARAGGKPMADELVFYTNPMSRGQIGRWALHEAGADYEQVIVDWRNKPPGLLAANPMGKVPTIVHHLPEGDRTVSEAAAGADRVCLCVGTDEDVRAVTPEALEQGAKYELR